MNTIKQTKRLYNLIWRLMLAKEKEDRIKLGSEALNELEKIQDIIVSNEASIDNLTYRLTNAALDLKERSEWIKYLYKAIEQDLNSQNRNWIVRTALRLKEEERK